VITPYSFSAFKINSDILLQLDRCCFPQSSWDESVWEGLFNHHPLTVLIKDMETVPCGYATVTQTAHEAELLRIGVHPDYRRKGIARQLLQEILAIVSSNQVDRLFLEVHSENAGAIQLYQSMDFVEIARRNDYYRHPAGDALILSKTLT